MDISTFLLVMLILFFIAALIAFLINKVGVCVCANCVSSRLNTTDPFSYAPCVHSHPAIKLAHHRAAMKNKNYMNISSGAKMPKVKKCKCNHEICPSCKRPHNEPDFSAKHPKPVMMFEIKECIPSEVDAPDLVVTNGQ